MISGSTRVPSLSMLALHMISSSCCFLLSVKVPRHIAPVTRLPPAPVTDQFKLRIFPAKQHIPHQHHVSQHRRQ